MTIKEAIQFLKPIELHSYPQKWADLGCGNGLFTQSLAMRLSENSKIYGVDKTVQDFSNRKTEKTEIEFVHADIMDSLPFGKLDGILMANSLHYIEDKLSFLQRIMRKHGPLKNFILIEYNRTSPNPWVPFPLPFAKAKELFSSLNNNLTRINERPSRYGNKSMYLAQFIKEQ